jgi:hypothetical protein
MAKTILTGGVLHDEFVKGEAFATSGGDAGAGSLGEAGSSDGHLTAVKLAHIVGDGTNNNGDALGILAEILDELGDGHWGAGGSAGDEATKDGLGEGGVGSAGEELEELNEELHVEVLGLGGSLVLVLEAALVDEIDTLNKISKPCLAKNRSKRPLTSLPVSRRLTRVSA